MADAHPLLELQRIDSNADALRKTRAELPERAALAERDTALAALATQREQARDRLVELGREERRIEGEVSGVRDEAKAVETTLYSGKVTVVSELEGLQTKLDSLKARQAGFEEEELAVMERQEALEDEIIQLDAKRDETERECASLRDALADAESRIDATLAEVATEREAHVPNVAPAWLAAYDKLRSAERHDGRVTARLDGKSCGACRMTLPVMAVTQIRKNDPDEVVLCQNCRRMLVP